jgi:hypothetical protein
MNGLSATRNLDAPTTALTQGEGNETDELCGSIGFRNGHAIFSLRMFLSLGSLPIISLFVPLHDIHHDISDSQTTIFLSIRLLL